MPTLYFAFANDPDRPLDELKREDAEINRLLEPLSAKGHFKIVRDSFATLEALADKLNLYKHDLVLFHFSGHAGSNQLLLDGEAALTKGIAAMLGDCPRLQLVVLNGCATAGQVQLLQARNVPMVIATHRPVEDPKAAAFAGQFYRALSLMDSVGAAFNSAAARVEAMDDQLNISRGLALREQDSNTPCWGLFTESGRQDALDWRLPTRNAGIVPSEYVPNQLLLKTLLEALGPYREDIASIVSDEKKGLDRSILDKREAILKALPHPISEQIRFLLTPRSANSDMKFFDQPGLDRLKQMVTVFDTVTELMAFIMLAQFWDTLNEQETLIIPDDTRTTIRKLFSTTQMERYSFDFVELIKALRILFDENDLPYFVEELKHLKETYKEGEPFFEACCFFTDLKPRLDKLGENEATVLSVMAEEQLSTVMGSLGFVAHYTIASIKNIEVLKNRSLKDPRYQHIVVKLVQRFVGLVAEPEILTIAMDSSSVLLMREGPDRERAFLNLTPFVIDENAFDEKATEAKIHYFERYLQEQDAYAFRHIYMPGDLPLIVAHQKNFRALITQFDTFSQLLFHQPMHAL